VISTDLRGDEDRNGDSIPDKLNRFNVVSTITFLSSRLEATFPFSFSSIVVAFGVVGEVGDIGELGKCIVVVIDDDVVELVFTLIRLVGFGGGIFGRGPKGFTVAGS